MKILKKIFFLFLILFQNINSDTVSFNPVPGSPFATTLGPLDIAFTQQLSTGNVFAGVPNDAVSNTVNVFQVNTTTGQLTSVGSFLTGNLPTGIAFTQQLSSGKVFAAVTNRFGNSLTVYSVDISTGVFTTLSTVSSGSFNHPFGIAFSQEVSGKIYAAVSNQGGTNFPIFSVDVNTGAFTEVAGSPFTAGGDSSQSVNFTQNLSTGNIFVAATNLSTVSVYQLNPATGFLTAVPGSPITTGGSPNGVAFSQELSTGNVFAGVATSGPAAVRVYQVDKNTGTFTEVSGSPFSAGPVNTFGIAFTQELFSGNVYAQVSNPTFGTVGVYQLDESNGTLTQITGSPFSVTGAPQAVAFTQQLSTGNIFSGVVSLGISIYRFTFITITSPTNGQTINNAMPTFTGRTQAGNTVTIFVDGNNVGTTTADSTTGNWSFTVSSTLSDDSSHTLTVTTTDSSSDTANAGPVTFSIDTPTFVTITSPTNGQVVHNARPMFTGTTEVGNTVTISIDGGAAQSATVDGSGNWSFTPTTSLSEGAHSAQAVAMESDGDTATASVNFSTDVGTFVTITTPANMAILNTHRPLISGTKESGDSVHLVVTNSNNIVVIDVNIPADSSENWSFMPTSDLPNGVYTITVTATDPDDGDTAEATSTFTVIVCTDIIDSLTLAIRQKYGIS